MEYLGYKGSLLPDLVKAIEADSRRPLHVLDAFSGTGVVASELRQRGHRVHANDHLALCATWASAALLVPSTPSFGGLAREGWAEGSQTYAQVVARLNALPPKEGFITRHFSPSSASRDGVERRYLTVANAERVDAIRSQITAWDDCLTTGEKGLLLSTLVAGVMDVSNTAGTYGCYLKNWKKKALQPLVLRPLPLPLRDGADHRVSCDEAVAVAAETDVDVLYADPPYTKRQYAAYYHVLETLVRDDEPELTGSTGLRPWQGQASDWCYKRRAPAALEALVVKSSASRLVLSYNEDGQISHELIMDTLSGHGTVAYREFAQRRYRSSQLTHKGAEVIERLYTLERR